MDSVSNNIDENIIGEYVITYSYLDDEVTYNCTRFVKVIDSTRPEVTLNPGIDTIKINGVFIDAGVTCSDNYDTSLTVAISGSVDTGVMGRYILTYTVTDDSSNSTDIIRIVNVVN